MTPQTRARHVRRVERILEDGPEVFELPEDLLVALDDAIGFDGVCAGKLDPGSLLPTRLTIAGHPAGAVSICDAVKVVVAPDQRARLRRLAERHGPVEVLGEADPAGRERDALYREVMAPQGFEHGLRAMLVAGGASWGFMHFLRSQGRPAFGPEEAAARPRGAAPAHVSSVQADDSRIPAVSAGSVFRAEATIAAALAPELGRVARQLVLQCRRGATAPGSPGVLVLDEHLAEVSMNADARAWLARFRIPDGELPTIVRSVAAAALAQDGDGPPLPAHASVRACTEGGAWVHLHASALDGAGTRQAAVVIGPALPQHLAPILGRAYGLTGREREIAGLVMDGLGTAEIAGRLFLSPYTVKDHLKAVFDKVGVRTRRELALAMGGGA